MKKIIEIIAEFFGENIEKITDSTTQNDIEKWDSLNSLLLVNEIENEYNIKISIDEIIEINSVLDIKNILKKHNVEY
jgi:acyl carrier protein|tara:strand:- start:247 stop:477 length:231 start_codon:yes stop_codon:yes gene_type:complete